MFYGNLDLPELGKIQTVKELLWTDIFAVFWCFSAWFDARVTV